MRFNNLNGKVRFFLLDLFGRSHIKRVLAYLEEEQFLPYDVLAQISRSKLNHLFEIARMSVPFYRKYSSYETLPTLNKETVRKELNNFISTSYPNSIFEKNTSGSTGKPLTYYVTSNTRSYLWAFIILSWEVAGYKIGDKVAFVAGSALLNFKSSFKHFVFYKLLNVDAYSAFTLGENDIEQYLNKLLNRKTKIIYGYASALDIMATYINCYNTNYKSEYLKGIICTSEMLTVQMRENIKKAFKVDVFNQYGCNEGGVSAFECEYHRLHLINTRCYYEIDGNGQLLATDLSNEGFVLLKYETGDLVEMSENKTCACKRNFPIINNVIGRSRDIITDNKNNSLHASFFHYLLANEKSIMQFQVLFNREAISLYLNVDSNKKNNDYYEKYINEIKKHLSFNKYNLYINSPFLTSSNAKHRHIIKTDI
jgi:phenylacetate-CoA ligase